MAHDHIVRQRVDRARVLEHRAHKPVDGDQPRFVLEPEGTRDARLLLEQEPVRPAARLQMQGTPHPREELLRRIEPFSLRCAEEPVLFQGRPRTISSQPKAWMSRSPPPPSFSSGSNR